MSSRNRVQYVKQDQPAFLKKFKEKVGMKSEPTVEDKRQVIQDECDTEEKDDEKPVVVVLGKGDLTSEEAAAHEEVVSNLDDGKIVFKKPTKRKGDCGLNASTKKTKQDSKSHSKNSGKLKDDKKKASCSTPAALLSFGYEDD